MTTPTFRPTCPNHGAPLEGIPFPMPSKGKGTCPVSGAAFAFEAETDEAATAVDKFGQAMKTVRWKVDGTD